jgi:tetratricopeptide (TPR) repeat protein
MPSTASHAVFLSYASQDTEAARRICDALRESGIEVWFDVEGGLEHGDAWDAKIRTQIKECLLFVPIISASTQARQEGYFRIEWELAAERAMGIASGVAFILPVVIDNTSEHAALVPDRFRKVQWTRLPGGVVPAAVKAHLRKLWSHRRGDQGQGIGSPTSLASPLRPVRRQPRAYALGMLAAILAVIAAVLIWRGHTTPSAIYPTGAPAAETQPVAAQARALFGRLDAKREEFALAEDLLKPAVAKDPGNADLWAAYAQLDENYRIRGWDMSDSRREQAIEATERAVSLDPRSFEVRLAQAILDSLDGSRTADFSATENTWRSLQRERPDDRRVLRGLASVLRAEKKIDEAIAVYESAARLPGGDPLALYNKAMALWFQGLPAGAESAMQEAIAQKPFDGALLMLAHFRLQFHGDLSGAQAFLNRLPPSVLRDDRGTIVSFRVNYYARNAEAALSSLAHSPQNWLNDYSFYVGPKGQLAGDAQQLAGHRDAAMLEWKAALRLTDARLETDPKDGPALAARLLLLASMGENAAAEQMLPTIRYLVPVDAEGVGLLPLSFTRTLALLGRRAEAIQQIEAILHTPESFVICPLPTLRINPWWDPLRGEPKFDRLLAESAVLDHATTGTSTAVATPGSAP